MLSLNIIMHIDSFYELELKSLLTKEEYDFLLADLSKDYIKLDDDIVYNKRYRPGDIRLRHSNRVFELVKKDLINEYVCKKTVFSFDNKDDFDKMQDVFDNLQLISEPTSIKHNQDFRFDLDGYNYIISLQDIKDFTYFIEIKIQIDDENFILHEMNIKSIFKRLNLKPINPKEFSTLIAQYVLKNKKLL